MMNISIVHTYAFALALIGAVAAIAFIMSRKQGQRLEHALIEAIVWGGCLATGAGADYLLAALNNPAMA